ncbi:MAG: hypothetical protein ACREMF_03920 [Gemmatimonadales bacterium]
MRRLSTFTSVALCVAAPLVAQDFQEFCRGTLPVTVGHWAAFKFTGGRSDGSTMRMAIVGTERFGDSTYYWYETQMTTPKGNKTDRTIMQMLVAGLGSPRVSLRGFVMKNNDQPAMRAPDMMIGMMARPVTQGVSQFLEQRCRKGGIQSLGVESVTVPAGTFRALHITDQDGTEAWLTREFGAFAMVKVIEKNGTTMELTGRGTDAKSAITETPQPMMR